MLLRQPLNSRWFLVSMAIDTGSVHGAVDQRRATVPAFASTSTTSALSVRFTYTLPSPADTRYSALPPSGIWAMTLPALGSIAVNEWASPFDVNTRFDAPS